MTDWSEPRTASRDRWEAEREVQEVLDLFRDAEMERRPFRTPESALEWLDGNGGVGEAEQEAVRRYFGE